MDVLDAGGGSQMRATGGQYLEWKSPSGRRGRDPRGARGWLAGDDNEEAAANPVRFQTNAGIVVAGVGGHWVWSKER